MLAALKSFDCTATCQSNISPGVTVKSATKVSSCQAAEPVRPPTYRGLVLSVLHSIGHQGAPVYRDGPDSDTLRNGQELKNVLLDGEKDVQHGAQQAHYEIESASIANLQDATREALQICKTQDVGLEMKKKLFEIWDSRTGQAQVKEQAYGMYNAAQARHYQDIRNLNFNAQGNDRFKGRLACFSGSEIQKMIDEFVKQSGIPAKVPPPVKDTRSIDMRQRDKR